MEIRRRIPKVTAHTRFDGGGPQMSCKFADLARPTQSVRRFLNVFFVNSEKNVVSLPRLIQDAAFFSLKANDRAVEEETLLFNHQLKKKNRTYNHVYRQEIGTSSVALQSICMGHRCKLIARPPKTTRLKKNALRRLTRNCTCSS